MGHKHRVRRPPAHLREVLGLLREAGAGGVEVSQRRHFRVTYTLGGRPQVMTVSVSPRSYEEEVKSARRLLARQVEEQRACSGS